MVPRCVPLVISRCPSHVRAPVNPLSVPPAMSHHLLGRQQRHRKERSKSRHEAAEKRQASAAIYQQQLEQHATATQQALAAGLPAPAAPEAPKPKRRPHHTKDGSLRNHRVRVRRADSRAHIAATAIAACKLTQCCCCCTRCLFVGSQANTTWRQRRQAGGWNGGKKGRRGRRRRRGRSGGQRGSSSRRRKGGG